MNRLIALKKQFLTHNCDAVILSQKENIYYFTGLHPLHPTERESFLLVTPKKTILYHSPFIKPPKRRSLICIPMNSQHPFQSVIRRYCSKASVIGIEKNNLTVSELERLQTMVPDTSLIAIEKVPLELRSIKDKQELSAIKKAMSITTKTLKWAQKYSTKKEAAEITEIQFKQRIEDHMMELGADGLAFPTIVAFDSRTTFPHHRSDHRRLKKDSIILVDVGAKVDEYCADMTRTWCIGKPSPLFLHIETIVKNAHTAALSLVGARRDSPIIAHAIDSTTRQVIKDAGYDDYFIHNTGHGVGLEAHESPSLSPGNPTALQPGMVITIEPGIYLPGKFGYRHEDTIIISQFNSS